MQFDLNYTISGEGRPFFFQHGLGANVSQPQGILASLEGVCLISMDCPGHGQSRLPDAYLPSFSNYSADVIRLMDHIEIPKAIFGGISMGAGISVYMAIHHPERVEGLVLVRPAWLAAGTPDNLAILLDIAERLDKPDGQELFEQSTDFEQIRQALPNAAKSILGMFNRDQQASTSRILSHMVKDAPLASLKELAGISHPTLVVANQDDPLHPMFMGEEIASHIPSANLVEVISRYKNNELHGKQLREAVSTFLSQL
ncbi:MAG: alpha/beta hydrolase [Bacteroidota bacterium]